MANRVAVKQERIRRVVLLMDGYVVDQRLFNDDRDVCGRKFTAYDVEVKSSRSAS